MRGAIGVPLGRLAAVLVLSVAVLGWAMKSAHAHHAVASPDSPDPQAELLTQALLDLNVQYQSGGAAQKPLLLGQLLSAAASRQQFLAQLVEDDPGEVLRVALPGALRAALPSTVQAYVEEEVEAEGVLEILHEDWPAGGYYRYGLYTATTRYSLHFASDEPTHLLTGARIRVRGIKLDTMLALAGGNKSVQTVSTAPVLSPLGEQRTLVMLVNFADNPAQPWTRDEVAQAIFGTVSAFMSENSYGATSVTGDVTEWMTIALSSSACDTGTLASQAQQAATAAGWVPGNYSRWIYAFPHNMCGFGGASFIGGSPSQSWLNGEISLRIAGHEFGHGLGLWHSHSMDCGDVPLGRTCTASEYGDTLDLMGTAQTGHYNAFQKERLGWLAPLIVTETGTYTLDAYETAGAPLAFKIFKSVDSTGARTWYYVEVRKRIGFDYTLSYPGMTNGVAIRLGSESSGNTSYLLDMTPNSGSNDWLDPSLGAAQSFSDADAGVTITTESITTTGAAVTVLFDTAVTIPPDSTVSLTEVVATDQPTYSRNQTVSITSTVTSSGSPVAGASVTFTVINASGATVVANGTTGSDGAAVYKLRVKRQDPVGTYQVDAVAKKDGSSASATTQFGVR